MRRSKIIAYAAISMALSLLFIALAFFIKNVSIAFNALAGLVLYIPLVKKYYLSSIYSYISTSLIGLAFGFFHIIPFILFYGLYVGIKFYTDEYLFNKYFLARNKKTQDAYKFVILIFKLIYFNLIFFVIGFVLTKITGANIIFSRLKYRYLIFIVGNIIFIAIDQLLSILFVKIQYIVDKYIKF